MGRVSPHLQNIDPPPMSGEINILLIPAQRYHYYCSDQRDTTFI